VIEFAGSYGQLRAERRFSAADEQRGDRCWHAQIGLFCG
jgi:hypothetical protein